MNTAKRIAEEMVRHGRAPVFGVPGSGLTLTLIDELEKRGREFVLTHFEGAAAIMAATTGRLSGKAGVCLSIKGPGLANMVPGLAVASLEAFPVIAFVEAYGARTPSSKAHKRMDQRTLTGAVSKCLTQINAEGPSFADLAALAEAETPGPVVVELAQPYPEETAPLPSTPSAPQSSLEKSLRLIDKAERPVVIAGTLAERQKWSDKLNALNIPVFSTAAIKGIVDETLVHAAGVYTGVGLELAPEHAILSECDLVVCLGLRPNEVLATKPFGRPAINVAAVCDAGEEAFAFDAVVTCADAPTLLDLLAIRSWGSDLVASAHARLRASTTSGVFLPAQAYSICQTVLPSTTCGVFDTGYFCTIGEHIWRARDASRCLMSGQARYMGTGVPMALGAVFHDQSRPVVVFIGDGGIGPFLAEVKIAVERKLPLLVCLLTDGFLASIRTRALRDNLTQRPVKVAAPSWERVFEAMGMPAFRVGDASGLESALRAWRWQDGPAYVEVQFEPGAYEAMTNGIR